MTAFPSVHPVAAQPRCVHCGAACDGRDENGVPHCTLEHLLLARILGTATDAGGGTPATSPSVTTPAAAGGVEEA
jgi:hypothetical protein